MPFISRLSLFASAVCTLATLSTAPSAQADTLSWGTSGYTYNASQAPTANTAATPGTVATVNGNTVSIQYSTASYFNTSYVTANATTTQPSPGVGTNTANTTLYTDGGTNNGTQGTGSKALEIIANFDNAGNIVAGAGISVTIFFSKPVSNLMFSFWDVDTSTSGSANPYNDLISNLSGRTTAGSLIAPNFITNGSTSATPAANGVANTSNIAATAATITGSGNAIQGAGTPAAGSFAASAGAAFVQFGATPISQFSFTYTDTAAAAGGSAHSTVQIIGLSDLQFTTVPEPSTWAFFGVAGVVGALALRRRARQTV